MSSSNPLANWYYGTFTVVLTPEAPVDDLPQGVELEITTGSKKAIVHNGSLKQSMGGIAMRTANDQPFRWGYSHIIEILDANGNLLWQNRDFKQA